MDKTIKITGTAKMSVRPDLIRLEITLSKVEKKYEDAVRESAEKHELLANGLASVGFAKEDLKTLHFQVNTEYESVQDTTGIWKQQMAGYRYHHRMKLEFAADNELLGKVLGVIAACPGEPEFTITYTVKDPDSVKNELLTKAVIDSRVKAEVLAAAAGLKLKEIVNIDYSWGEMAVASQPVNGMMLRKCEAAAVYNDIAGINLNADDIIINDTVTVVWSFYK